MSMTAACAVRKDDVQRPRRRAPEEGEVAKTECREIREGPGNQGANKGSERIVHVEFKEGIPKDGTDPER